MFYALQNDKNLPIVNSILEMLYAFVTTQEEHLMKSDFNTNTCILSEKLFEYSIKANVLKAYIFISKIL